jgi:uncharacterized SAM-binding protein YcdF (DUF218 family)
LKRRPAIALYVTVGFIAVLALDVGFSMLHYEYARRHYTAKPLIFVDAVIVLFSGSSPDGLLNAETRRRLAWASAIYRAGLTGAIICSGGGANERGSGAVQMREFLIAEGIPAVNVVAETLSFDTITNMRRSRTIADVRHWRRLAVVSSPMHVARALRVARKERMGIVAAGYDPEIVNPPVGRLEAIVQVHHEWLAAIAALLPDSVYLPMLERWRVGAGNSRSVAKFAIRPPYVNWFSSEARPFNDANSRSPSLTNRI